VATDPDGFEDNQPAAIVGGGDSDNRALDLNGLTLVGSRSEAKLL
jgi:hypothetical protein